MSDNRPPPIAKPGEGKEKLFFGPSWAKKGRLGVKPLSSPSSSLTGAGSTLQDALSEDAQPILTPGRLGSGRSLKMPSLKKESPPPQPKEDVTSPRSPVGTRHNWEKPKRKSKLFDKNVSIRRFTPLSSSSLHPGTTFSSASPHKNASGGY